MKRLCAWCGIALDPTSSSSSCDAVITHGICGPCANKMFLQTGIPLRNFLDRFALPIAIVDSEGVVRTVNTQARSMLGKELSDIEGHKGGDVFQCVHAILPGGCGNTVHCSGCAIRRTVMETHTTGKSFLRIPALLKQQNPKEPQDIRFLISTEKVGDYVLLRIDGVEEKAAA